MDVQESGKHDAERGNQTEGNERNEESVDVESGNGEPGKSPNGRGLPSAANVSEGETNAVQIFPEKCRPLEPRAGCARSAHSRARLRNSSTRRERYSSVDVLGCSGETGGGVLKLDGLIVVGTRG